MKIRFSGLDKKVKALIRDIGTQAQRKELPAYLVGGFVRDILLKIPPAPPFSKGGKGGILPDIDIVVEGDAVVFARALAGKNVAALRVYNQFGTATLEYRNGLHVDLATAREETYPCSGALPVVRPGTIHDDLFRRDFTINAMAAAIHPERFGELVDVYNGLKDLQEGKIRILHRESFIDDPTRILRAVRFEQRFDFSIEPRTLGLLKSALKRKAVDNVKPPRFFAEFRKVLKEPCPAKAVRRLHRLGGLDFFKKGLEPQWQLLTRMERNISRLSRDPFYKEKDWGPVYLLFLAIDMKKRDIEQMAKEFHLTRLEKKILSVNREIPGIIKRLEKEKLAPSRVYQILIPLEKEAVYFIRAQTAVNRVGRYIDEFLKKSCFVKLAVTGEDLKKINIPSGKKMKKILNALLLEKIDGKIRTREEEVREAKKMRGV